MDTLNFQILDELKKILNENELETGGLNPVDGSDKCTHEDVATEAASRICMKCGYEIDKELNYDKEWRFYQNKDSKMNDTTRCHMRKTDVKTIHKDLENLGFNNKIVNTANDLYQKVTQGKIYRGNSRKSIVFACVFSAFKMHDNPQTCENLIRIFNLKRKIGLKGLKHIHLNIEKDTQIQNIRITPYHIISDMMQKFITTDQNPVKEVHAIYDFIKNKSSILNRSRPNSTAAGVIYYYILKNKKSLTLKQFSNEVELSELTIKKIVKQIDLIYGTNLIK